MMEARGVRAAALAGLALAAGCGGGEPSCPAGQAACGGVCIDVTSDPTNCGACGKTCSASQICSGATCACPAAAPRACGTICCAGTACCSTGNTCQPAHQNGLGQTYYDCQALGTPGSGGTYTQTMAAEAGAAWASGSIGTAAACGTSSCWEVVANGQCAVWCYGGTLSGRVLLDSTGTACQCPTSTASAWN